MRRCLATAGRRAWVASHTQAGWMHRASALHTHVMPSAATAAAQHVAAVSSAADPAAASASAGASASSSKKKQKKTAMKAGPALSLPGWEVVIGIEVHAQITARSKLFSGASTRFGAPPNAQAAALDAALPGTLPVLNAHAVAQAVRTGLGLGGQVQPRSTFERKHYFYCDMPQGYQITQQQHPIVRGGSLSLDSLLSDGTHASVRITRIQLEQDSGKNVHDLHPSRTYVDLNRAGVGLMEIVSEPDMRSSEQAAAYIRKLTNLLQHLGTCRAHMEDGSLRCDVNVSVRRTGSPEGHYGERVEVKNLNSLRSLQRAIDHEFQRQVALAERGEPVRRETRGFDAKTGATVLMRTKEQMLDYRFAPEPDLPPLVLSPHALTRLQSDMPELPDAIAARFASEYGLSSYDIGVLSSEEGAPAFLDALVYGEGGRRVDQHGQLLNSMKRKPKICANWLTSELFGRLKRTAAEQARTAMDDDSAAALVSDSDETAAASFAGAGVRAPTLASSPVSAARLGELIDLVESGSISGRAGKDLLDLMLLPDSGEGGRPLQQIVDENGWGQVSDAARVDEACRAVMAAHPSEAASARAGNKRHFGYLSGAVLKYAAAQGTGQLNPAVVSKRMAELIADLPAPTTDSTAEESKGKSKGKGKGTAA